MKTFHQWLEAMDYQYQHNEELVAALKELLSTQNERGTADQTGHRINYGEMNAFRKLEDVYKKAVQKDTLSKPDEIQKVFTLGSQRDDRHPETEQAFIRQIQLAIQVASEEHYGPNRPKSRFGDDED